MGNDDQESKELLAKMLEEIRRDYPLTLRAEDVSKIMGCKNKTQVYKMVKYIPGAKKLECLGWRIPRDTFFAWYYFNKGEKGYEDEKARL